MQTHWTLIREAMNTFIDSCERLDRNGYAEQHRELAVDVRGQQVSIYEFMISAWTMPENARYEIIRRRHELGIDQPYIPEQARMLVAMAAACAELIGAGDAAQCDDSVRGMLRWYRNHFDPHVERAVRADGSNVHGRA